jgi:hypothetical protein
MARSANPGCGVAALFTLRIRRVVFAGMVDL